MLKEIKDCCNHVVCKADSKSGLVETKYKKQFTSIVLPINSEYTIVRDKTKTVIKRINNEKFEVYSEVLIK